MMISVLFFCALCAGEPNRADCDISVEAAIRRRSQRFILPDSIGDDVPPKPVAPGGDAPSELRITMDASTNMVATLQEVLGPRGKILLSPEGPVTIKREAASVTIAKNTSADYSFSGGTMVLAFPAPTQPTINASVWKFKVHPKVNFVEIRPDDKAMFDVGSGITHKQQLFDLKPIIDQQAVKTDAASAPTPIAEVQRVLGLLPKPTIGFVDFGCGDGRWCIAAAERWGCSVTGVEIDPSRAAAARERVKAAGLEKLITIVTGDAVTTDVQADVGIAYLYADVLQRLLPRLQKLRAFASYLHRPPGLPVIQNGDSWFYQQAVAGAVWNGQTYTHPICTNPNCEMCRSIRSQLAAPQSGYYVKRCQNGRCWWEWVSQ